MVYFGRESDVNGYFLTHRTIKGITFVGCVAVGLPLPKWNLTMWRRVAATLNVGLIFQTYAPRVTPAMKKKAAKIFYRELFTEKKTKLTHFGVDI